MSSKTSKGLASLIGKYNDDPSWEEFPAFLEEYRREIDSQPDPYEAFNKWMLANGFADVANCKPEDVDLERLDEAIAAYGEESTDER